jgi:hypothetical protein
VGPEEQAAEYGSLDAYVEFFARHWATEVDRCWSWCESRPEQSLQIRYEDLVCSPDAVLKHLFSFLGVSVAESLVTNCQHEAAFEKLTHGRRLGDEDRTSLFRRGIPGDWHNHFNETDNARFLAIAGDLSSRLGYC